MLLKAQNSWIAPSNLGSESGSDYEMELEKECKKDSGDEIYFIPEPSKSKNVNMKNKKEGPSSKLQPDSPSVADFVWFCPKNHSAYLSFPTHL